MAVFHLCRLEIEGLRVGQGICGVDRRLGKADADGLLQIPTGASSILCIVAGARASPINAAQLFCHGLSKLSTNRLVFKRSGYLADDFGLAIQGIVGSLLWRHSHVLSLSALV